MSEAPLPRKSIDALLVERVRLGLWILVATTILFALADQTTPPWGVSSPIAIKAALLGFLALAIAALRWVRRNGHVVALAQIVVPTAVVAAAVQSSVAHDQGVGHVVAAALLLGCAVLLPWRVGDQAVAVASVLVVVLADLGLHPSFDPFPLGGVGAAGVASLMIVRELRAMRGRYRRAQSQLRWHERTLEEFLENAHDLVQWVDGDGRVVYVNGSWRRTLGYGEGEATALSIRDVLAADSLPDWNAAVERLAQGRGSESVSIPMRLRAKCGDEVDVQGLLQSDRRPGAPVRAIMSDVTGLRQAQESARRTEEFFQSVLHTAPSLIATVDLDGRFLYVNRTLPGIDEADVLRRTLYDYIEPAYVDVARSALAKARELRSPTTYECLGAGSFSESAWYVTRVAPIVHDGEVESFALVSTDTTEQRRLQEERRLQGLTAEGLVRVGRELIAAMDEPSLLRRLCRLTTEVFPCDTSHTFLIEEDGAARVAAGYGDSADQWRAMRSMRVPEAMVDPLLRRLAAGGAFQAVIDEATDLPTSSMALRYGISLALYVPLRRCSDIFGVHTVAFRGRRQLLDSWQIQLGRGIGDLASLALGAVRFVDELGAANRFKSDFLANMSHELRSPLDIIVGYSDILLEAGCGELNAEQQELVGKVRRCAKDLLDLMNATLELSRHRDGPVTLDLEPVDVDKLVDEMVAAARARSNRSSVEIRGTTCEAAPALLSDRRKLRMILTNLLDNAVKYTPFGTIALEANALAGGGVEFAVRDSGVGIPAAVLARIFEPFEQGESRDGQTSGVGLGLYIVHTLVASLGGRVTVDSTVGVGTTFRVQLPSAPPALPTQSVAGRPGL